MLPSATLPLILRIIWYGTVYFSCNSSFYRISCFYNNFYRMNQSCSTMILISPVSCAFYAFLFIASFAFIFSVIERIIFALWLVWQSWVWLQIIWYVLFCTFSLRFDKSVVIVIVLGSEVFAPIGVKSKDGRLFVLFWSSNSWLSLQIYKSVYSYSLTLSSQRLQPLYVLKKWSGTLQ